MGIPPSVFDSWTIEDRARTIAYFRTKSLMQNYEDFIRTKEAERQQKAASRKRG